MNKDINYTKNIQEKYQYVKKVTEIKDWKPVKPESIQEEEDEINAATQDIIR